MTAAFRPVTQSLDARQVLRFEHPASVCAQAGTVWLTIDGEPQDIVLERGECRSFDGRSTVFVTPLSSNARVSLRKQASAPWTQRLARMVGLSH